MNDHMDKLQLVRLGIETSHEFVVYIHSDCLICKSEGFEVQKQVHVIFNNLSIIATLNIINSTILKTNQATLSESAWIKLGVNEGDEIRLAHLKNVSSLKYVRSKIFGNELPDTEINSIITDIVNGKYSNIHLASFITACAKNGLSINEITALTRSMTNSGEKIHWDYPMILDKHSIGGIPGNRTTPIVVAIVAAAGLIIPKTSSRAITSPAGTADTVETMTNVNLTADQIRHVVEKEGGCMAWGGALGLSPADDIIIRVERSLNIDPTGQMIASVISKKVAVGATHVVIDIPVGPTAKVRSDHGFIKLKGYFDVIGKAMGIHVTVVKSDGIQPLGKGIGPALEAKDILAILRNEKDISLDLKNKAILLASTLIQIGKNLSIEDSLQLATQLLESGKAYKKFQAICEAQGGFYEPTTAPYTYDVVATHAGTVTKIDNRNLAQVAKLAGAPHDPTAGIEFFTQVDTQVEAGETLYRIHAQTKGELEYAITYSRSMPHIVKIIREV